VQALWKPVATEEAFEIVRRRLFEPVIDVAAREAVCRAFAEAYISEGAKLPGETQEGRYLTRLVQAYPIHPELFDRLYEDWTTIQGFQRTRGVLKLMAKVIYRLWKDNNADLMIMPGSLPLYEGNTRHELVYHIAPGCDAVLEKDIDGDRAETTHLENKEPRFGSLNAARRVARTLFLGSAPAASGAKPGIRGLDRAHVLLGCLQPGQSASTYVDALGRLSDRLHYLNASGDKAQDATRFWFDTRANLRREMEDRKARFSDQNEVRGKLAEVLRKLAGTGNGFEGVHVFTPHGDVPDDGSLRLCFLPPEKYYLKTETRLATEEVLDFVRNNGTKPRYRGNRLLFVAPDQSSLARLRDSIRTALAWGSITDDVKDGRLNIDRLQEQQAKKELVTAEEVLPRVARECYKWLLCPVMAQPTDKQITVEAFSLNPAGNAYGSEVERVAAENELIITTWSPVHLRNRLREIYWKPDRTAVNAMAFWEDTQRYLYLPRLKDRSVLSQAIVKGAATKDFFATAYGQAVDTFEGFKFGDANIQLDDTLLLIEPEAAKAHEAAIAAKVVAAAASAAHSNPNPTGSAQPGAPTSLPLSSGATAPVAPSNTPATQLKSKAFYGSVEVNASTAKMRMVQIAEEVIALLASDPTANVKVSVEISAEYTNGASDQIKRAVSENSASLKFKTKTWE
jgi:predicted AAA+ superfamily ATPase